MGVDSWTFSLGGGVDSWRFVLGCVEVFAWGRGEARGESWRVAHFRGGGGGGVGSVGMGVIRRNKKYKLSWVMIGQLK